MSKSYNISKSYNKTKSLKMTIHQTKKNTLIVSKHSKKMLIIYKPLLKKLEKESALSQFGIKENSIMRNFLAYIYLQFSEFNKIINTLNVSNSISLNTNVSEKIKAIIKDHLSTSKYVDPNITTYISNNINNCKIISYENTINNKKFVFNFITYDKINITNLDNIVKNMLVFLQILIKISKNSNNETNECSKDGLNITFFLTPFLKKMNISKTETETKTEAKTEAKEILGVNNVNSGFNYTCLTSGLIFIYRKQEFFKVFVHEALHAYGIDTALQEDFSKNKNYNKFIKLFASANIHTTNVGINEAMTEFWTALLYLCVNSYQCSKNLANFIYNFERLYKLELAHALYQISKILHYNDLTYSSFTKNSNSNSKYRENSHIFSYFIVKTMMLMNHEHMLNSQLFDLNNISNMNSIEFNSFINIKLKSDSISVNKLFANVYDYTIDPLFIKIMNIVEMEHRKHYNNYANIKTYKLKKKQNKNLKSKTRKLLKHKSNTNDTINMENYMLSNLRMMIYDYTI